MKNILFTLTLLLTITATAALRGVPFKPEEDKRFSDVEGRATVLEALPAAQTYTSDGLLDLRVARATLDCSTAANCTVGAHSLGVTLPAKALLIRSFYYIPTQLASASSGTIAIHCEDADNILTAANLTSYAAGSLRDANQNGVSNTFTSGIAASCPITATIATGAYTSGKANFFIEYVNHD